MNDTIAEDGLPSTCVGAERTENLWNFPVSLDYRFTDCAVTPMNNWIRHLFQLDLQDMKVSDHLKEEFISLLPKPKDSHGSHWNDFGLFQVTSFWNASILDKSWCWIAGCIGNSIRDWMWVFGSSFYQKITQCRHHAKADLKLVLSFKCAWFQMIMELIQYHPTHWDISLLEEQTKKDGLAVLKSATGSESERMRKRLIKTFQDNDLSITSQTNITSTNFLDMTLNLTTESYKPYRKPNDQPLNVLDIKGLWNMYSIIQFTEIFHC